VSLAVLLICYWGIKPILLDTDSNNQYIQALTGEYNDWHPVWYTLLTYTLPLKLFGSIDGLLPFQLVISSLVFGCMATIIWEYSNIKYAAIALSYLLLNPFVTSISMFLWKDVAFSLAAAASMLCAVKIYFTRGEWAKSHVRIILAAVCLTNATLFRHNGILFTGSMMAALLFIMDKKRWVELLLIFAAMLCVIKGPIYSALDVTDPGDRPVEVLGLPITVIINVANSNPEALDEETAEFVDDFLDTSVFNVGYKYIIFNSVKWKEGTDLTVVDEVGTAKVLKMAWRCFVNDKADALNAIFHLTDIVYAVDGETQVESYFKGNIAQSTIESQGNKTVYNMVQLYNSLIYSGIFKYVTYIGTAMLAMLAFMLGRSNLRRWAEWKRLFLCLPVFVYNFGTMLLLSSIDYRFFYETFLLCPLVILIMLKDNRLDGAIK
jgi:hypothetical protein